MVEAWEAFLRRPDAFAGRSARVHRRIMQSLVREAKRTRSARVQKSTRQIAEDADCGQRTVARHLKEMKERGLFAEVLSRGRETTSVVLVRPSKSDSTEVHAGAACSSVESLSSAPTHPIFGSQGLRGNQELTFNCLDTYRHPLTPMTPPAIRRAHGRLPVGERSRAWRQVAPPSGRGGVIPRRISEITGLDVATVRAHLTQMAKLGLAVKQDGLWYRLAFDADEVAREWGIEDVPARRKARHLQQRKAYWEGRAALPHGCAGHVIKENHNERVLYVDPRTGRVLWSTTGTT